MRLEEIFKLRDRTVYCFKLDIPLTTNELRSLIGTQVEVNGQLRTVKQVENFTHVAKHSYASLVLEETL